MLKKVLQDIQSIEKSLVQNGKYINKYDALSLSILDIDDDSNTIVTTPKMEGLQQLVTDISTVLSNGFDEVQTNLVDIDTGIIAVKTASEKLNRSVNSNNNVNYVSHSVTKEQVLKEKKNLSNKLQDLYDKITKLLEMKSRMLDSIENMFEVYYNSIVSCAMENGVLNTLDRANTVIDPFREEITHHSLLLHDKEYMLLDQIRDTWSQTFLDSNDKKAAERHLLGNYHRKAQLSLSWFSYVKIGAVVVLLMWSISECINNELSGRNLWDDPTFAIFMCLGDFILLLWMWGVSIHVWSSAGIDYFRLLELEDTELGRSKYPNLMIYNSATNLSLIFLLTFVLYNKIMRRLYHYYDVTHKDYGYTLAATHSIPCLLLVYFVYRMVVPSETRKVWWFFLWRVLAAPFYSVNFCDGYIGDLLTSLVRVLVPLLYSFAYLLISCYSWFSNHIDLATATSDHWWKDTILLKSVLVPWLTLLPLWLRLVQCLRRSVECGRRWPQIGNALKYTSAILVISIGTFKPNSRNSWLWLLGFVGATLYQFTWDLTQDWGVIRVTLPSSYSNMKEAIGGISISIRENKMLGSNWVYYTVICFNLVLRFAWTLTVLGTAKGTSTYNRSDNSIKTFSAAETFWHHLGPCIAAAEILRRMVWGFFRLEWEHLEKFGMLSTYDPINNSAKKDSDVELSYSNIYREEDVNFEKMQVNTQMDIPKNSIGNFHDSHSSSGNRYASVQFGKVDSEREDSIDINAENKGAAVNRLKGLTITAATSLQEQLLLYFEYEFLTLLPAFMINRIDKEKNMRALPNLAAKFRCVEAFIFGSVVLAFIIGLGLYSL